MQNLIVENLEDRMMLSTVQIYAAGGTGQETLELRIDDAVVSEFRNVGGDVSAREFVELEFSTEQTLTADQVRIDFVNDFFDPASGFDRDLFVDRIVIDGVTFQTEGPSVYHTGLFVDGQETGSGLLETETLNINGALFFNSDNGARDPTDERQVTFVARGTTGDEVVALRIDGQVVERFELSQINQQYEFKTSDNVTPDQIQFEFENDLFDSANGIDRNVTLSFLELENLATNELTRYDGNSPDTFSTGTWRAVDGVTDGFGRGDTLHSNGFFRFENNTNPGEPNPGEFNGVIRFAAGGATGEEVVQLLANDQVIFETQLSRSFETQFRVPRFEYQVEVDQAFDLTDLKLQFVNDGFSADGTDRNVMVDYIYIFDFETGETQRTTAADASTFSTGSFVGSELASGTGRGHVLHTNGYFQFANSSRILIDAVGTTGEERFQVIVNDQVVGEFGVGEGTQVEWEVEESTRFAVDIDGSVDIDDIRVQFVNDGIGANGFSRDLTILDVRLDGRSYETFDTAFSTGSFVDGILTPGTRRGSTLHTNGFFQYGAVPDFGFAGLNDSRGFSPLVSVRWLEPSNTGRNPFGAFTGFNEESGDDIIVRLLRNESGGLDGPASITYQVVAIDGPIPGSVSQDPVTVVFEDGQLAANLVIPVTDNNVADAGFFQIRQISATDGFGGFVSFDVELSDQD